MWSAHEKAALLAEIDAEGGKVRLVARRHRVWESLLYNWRSARKAAAVAMGAAENVEFIPAGIIEGEHKDLWGRSLWPYQFQMASATPNH
jgi:hypothetical protein